MLVGLVGGWVSSCSWLGSRCAVLPDGVLLFWMRCCLIRGLLNESLFQLLMVLYYFSFYDFFARVSFS